MRDETYWKEVFKVVSHGNGVTIPVDDVTLLFNKDVQTYRHALFGQRDEGEGIISK